ncbi:MAG: heparinase II/III family protein [Gemmatimonadota bacterium]|nr:heparinase II/III family protein [Gemmatimonadota bacterium]
MFHHDEFPDKLVHISDASFFDALDPDHPGLEEVRSDADSRRYDEAFGAWWRHFLSRSHPVNPFARSVEQLRSRVVADPDLADTIVNGGRRRFGQVEIDFAGPVAFNAWFGDQSKYGFHYLGWMDCLTRAALDTRDERYIDAYLEIFRQWYAARHEIKGARRMHPVFYELGLSVRSHRFVNFLYAVKLLELGHLLSTDHIRQLFKSFLGAARWLTLEQNAKGYREGNWQMHGISAMIHIGFLLPEFRESREFRTVGAHYLEQHMEKDYYADGGHSERCYSYGSGCLRHLEEATLLAEANPDLQPPATLDWRERTSNAYAWFLKMAGPGGEMPGINDGSFLDGTGLLKQACDFTRDGTYLWPIRHKLDANGPEPAKPGFESQRLETSEFCVMRSGWEPEDAFMLINHGQWPGGHSHMGILDINLYAFGVPLAAEVSRFGPYDAPWDMYFRSEQAHNHVVIEGALSARPEIRGEEIQFGSTASWDFFSGRHRAYEVSAGVVIERRILFFKPWGFLVSDAVGCSHRRRSALWYLHSVFPFVKHDTVAAAEGDRRGLLVASANTRQLKYAFSGIDYLEEMVREIPIYSGHPPAAQWPDRYFIALRGWGVEEPVVPFDVLLLPYRGARPDASVTTLACRIDGRAESPVLPRALKIVAGDRHLLVFHGVPGVSVTANDISFSGHAAAIEYANDRPSKALVQRGSQLTVAGRSIPISDRMTQEIEL